MLRQVLAVLCLTAAAEAQVSIRLLEDRPYREGELIRAEVRPPPIERWQYAGFVLEPSPKCGSLATPCFQSGSLWFDKMDPMLRFGEAATPLIVSLNRYLPALRPGHYRLALLARKLMSTSYGNGERPRYSLSNAVEVEIVPAPAAWVKQAIAASTAVLSLPPPNGGSAYDKRKVAAEQLRQFDTPEAWRASLAMMPAEEYTLLEGLAATREPARVCELMQTAIGAPAQAVSSYYIYALTQTCAKSDLQLVSNAYEILASSLSAKQNSAKVIAMETLVNRVQHLRMNEPAVPTPSWLPGVKEEFKKAYPSLDSWRRRQMLSLFAATFRSQDLIPLLESAMDAWKPGDYYEAPREALQSLNIISLERAQARIKVELRRAKTWLSAAELSMLPASAASFSDDELVADPTWDAQLRMAAIARYASPKALERMKGIFESQTERCQPELLAYFVRVDPGYVEQVLLHNTSARCALQYLERTPPLAMGPVLERCMTRYLASGDVALKIAAARSLARYGSPSSAKPLWTAFRYFHEYWKDRRAEVTQSHNGDLEETEYRNAIARGRQWLATESDLHALEPLCISDRCRYDTQEDLRGWAKPLKIEVAAYPSGLRRQVAQYHNIESLEALEEKLGQFPKGTEFALTGYGDGKHAAFRRLRDFGATKGLPIR